MNETDIPCSDCGTALIERTIHVRDLSVSTHSQGQVPIAECPSCEARYYPEQALIRLYGSATSSQPCGDS